MRVVNPILRDTRTNGVNRMRTILQVLGTIAGGLGVLYLALLALFDGLPAARIAGIVTMGIVALVVGILLTLAIVYRLTGRARTITTTENAAPVIDAEYRTLEAYKPPQALLPPPPVINVPAYRQNGQSQPLGMPEHAIPILRTNTEGGACEIPLNYLQRFLSLGTPSRSEWSGKREMYSAALEFCVLHGLLDRDARGGCSWRTSYPTEARRAWSEQFEHPMTGDK